MSSIRQALADNGDSLQTNAVKLLFRTHVTKDKVILLVEGCDDVNVFEKFFNRQQVLLHPVYNCDEIVRVLGQIEPHYQNRLLAIKDADFDRLKSISYAQYTNLFLTDFHDAEMMMLFDFGIVLLGRIYNVDVEKIPSYRSLMEDIESLSYLKLYNSIHNLRIDFEKPEIDLFYTGRAPLDYSAYATNLFSKLANVGKTVSDSTIIDFACALDYNDDDLLQLTNGHDLFDVIYRVIRLNYRQNLKKKEVAKKMRELYTWNRFEKTSLYDSLDKWFSFHHYSNVWNN